MPRLSILSDTLADHAAMRDFMDPRAQTWRH